MTVVGKRTRSIVDQVKTATAPAADAPAWTRLALFADLAPDDLAAMGAALVPVRFEAGDVIVAQAEPGDALYLIESGTLHVRTADGRFDKRFEAPETVGEMALVTREPRSASVTAVSAVTGLRLTRDRFAALVAEHPQIASILTKLVGNRLREIDGIRRVGKYRILGPLGSGGVSDVFLAEHPELGRQVAVKMLSHALVYHPSFGERFDREARVVAQLDHPNIVRVYDFEQAYGTRFIVMEKLDGQLLEDAISADQPFSWTEIRRLLAELADALAHAHEHGLVHRDVKPLNIFLERDGSARLFDFGIAIPIEDSECSGADRLGTPYYMAPEQIRGRALDGRTDLYALGMTAYELITGEVAFDAENIEGLVRNHLLDPVPDIRRLRPDVPADLLRFVQVCTAKAADDRFASAREAHSWLTGNASDAPVERLSLSVLCPSGARNRVRAEIERFQKRLEALGAEATVSAARDEVAVS